MENEEILEQTQGNKKIKGEKNWYVVNTRSGYENAVRKDIIARSSSMNVKDYIFEVLVVEEQVPVMKDGKPTDKVKIKNVYPGYVFIEMIMTDESWYVVRNTPNVTGFIGSSGKGTWPFPVSKEEMETVFKKAGKTNKDMFEEYLVGTNVKVIHGSLAGSSGTITHVDSEKGTVLVDAMIFGRIQSLELSFQDIEKA